MSNKYFGLVLTFYRLESMLSNVLTSLTGYGENICYNKLYGINQAYYRRLIPKYRNIATIFKSNYNRNSFQKII